MYQSILNLHDTQVAIKLIKDNFENQLAKKLNLTRVSAPLFVMKSSGLNDYLNGYERPVTFDALSFTGDVEIVQSLAKWKRCALARYNFPVGSGLYTDMNAIRRDEELDNIHSMYVDQWDWEKIITHNDRKLSYLKKTVKSIYSVILSIANKVNKKYPSLIYDLPKEIFFITTQELYDLYPNLTSKERENEITKLHKAVFLLKIGGKLKNGSPHDGRAADYDDWNLNGDLLLWHEALGIALEVSSMGIRVDEVSLVKQLEMKNEMFKLNNSYCQSLIKKELPYTIGGGIGQSRLCMYFLKKKHIGEVQASLWPEWMVEENKNENIILL